MRTQKYLLAKHLYMSDLKSVKDQRVNEKYKREDSVTFKKIRFERIKKQ